MARPARRRPTLPDHDPRAIRAALRREIYELGDARSQLDTIDFVVVSLPPASGVGPPEPAIEAVVNGVSTTRDLHWAPVPAWLAWVPPRSLRDHDGSRVASFAMCNCRTLQCEALEATVDIAGRYVLWRTADRHFGGPLVFDRSSYREELESALATIRALETPDEWALRETLDRASWAATDALGLQLNDAWWTAGGGLTLAFDDRFWRTGVQVTLPLQGSDGAAQVRRCLALLATGSTESWDASWRPWCGSESVVPPYPSTWRRVDSLRPSVHDT